MNRLICGKYDSQWKREYDIRTLRYTGRKEIGIFSTPMVYARRCRGGMATLEYARNQPWETWKACKS